MAILYTKNTSGAIRKLRNRKPTKEYLLALKKHIKWLKSLGLNINEKGRIVMMKKVNRGFEYPDYTQQNNDGYIRKVK